MGTEWLERLQRYFSLVSEVGYVFSGFLEGERKGSLHFPSSPPPPPDAAGRFGAVAGAGQALAEPSGRSEALLHLAQLSFFLGLLPHSWKRWSGGPGN